MLSDMEADYSYQCCSACSYSYLSLGSQAVYLIIGDYLLTWNNLRIGVVNILPEVLELLEEGW